MNKLITIYHGSKQIVEIPTFGLGRKNNDFGLGFYCTESNDLAKEWAVSSLRDGFSNRYTLDTEYLNTLNLNSPNYSILNWIAILVEQEEEVDGLYMQDILRGGITNDDPRIPRNLSE